MTKHGRLIDADALEKDGWMMHRTVQVDKATMSYQTKKPTDFPTIEPEPCEDAVSRNAIIQKLNTMDRYVSEELILCDTDKKFPKNEVFIVDDVYEEIVENLPSAQPDRSLWFRIGEVCVGESKGDISAEMAVEKIRELLREAERRKE